MDSTEWSDDDFSPSRSLFQLFRSSPFQFCEIHNWKWVFIGELTTPRYGVVSSSRTVDAVTYGVVRILLKAVKTSHISRCCLPYVKKCSTSHDDMHSGIVKWLSKIFKCSTFADAVKSMSEKGGPLTTPCIQCSQLFEQRRCIHAWHREKFIYYLN